MKTIILAGAGAVGKTVLLEACQALAEDEGLKVAFHNSNTRKTYAKAGLKSEKEALDNVDFNMKFQNEVMLNNCRAAYEACYAAQLQNADIFITDRSPYDYSAYYLSVFQPHMTIEMVRKKRTEADGYTTAMRRRCSEMRVVYLPYPAPWSIDTESSDSWRADKTGKNFIWSAVVESELAEANRRLHSQDPSIDIFFGRLTLDAELGSPEKRAAGLLLRSCASVL